MTLVSDASSRAEGARAGYGTTSHWQARVHGRQARTWGSGSEGASGPEWTTREQKVHGTRNGRPPGRGRNLMAEGMPEEAERELRADPRWVELFARP